MKAGWFIGLIMMYIILTPIFGMIEQNFLPNGQMSVIGTIITPPWETFTTPTGIITGGIMGLVAWLEGIWNMFTFGYACFTGTWIIIRYLLCAISGGIVAAIVVTRITGSSGT